MPVTELMPSHLSAPGRNLPEPDGFSLVQQLKAQKQDCQNSVIVQTVTAMKGDCETCLAAGAVDCISKPLD